MRKIITLAFLIFTNCAYPERLNNSSTQLFFIQEKNLKTFFRIARSPLNQMSRDAAWEKTVPQVKTVYIKSSLDGTVQPALYYNSGSSRKKPLLLVLHSWSEDYKQQFSIPYGIWAVKNDWVFIHPDYRGPFTNSMSTLSEFSVSDIIDALEYAKQNASIDTSRIYITGFSGGGMATLMMVGRYPHLWTAAAAWVPVYDLVKWYSTTRYAKHNYSRHIVKSCGGAPVPGSSAEIECLKRSPGTYLKNARGKNIQVYIAAGVKDGFVPPSHSLLSFNDIAFPEDSITSADMECIDIKGEIPTHLKGQYYDSLYCDAGIKLLFEKKSGQVVLKLYDGNHDVIYNAGLYWLSKQKKKQD